MFFDDRRTLRTIEDATDDHIIKIFFYLAFHQPQDGTKGYVIDKTQLQFDLKLGRTNFLVSLRWLKENSIVDELKLLEASDFMVNPYIVMNNGDRNERIAEWSRRQHLYIEKTIRNRKRRRREQLKKQNQL